MQRVGLTLLLVSSACTPFAQEGTLQERWPEAVTLDDAIPGEWLLALESGADPTQEASAAAVLADLGAHSVAPVLPGAPGGALGAAWRFETDADPAAVVAALETRVAWLEPNRRYTASASAPNDPLFSYQWHLSAIGLLDAWDAGVGEGVTVAVLDTGVSAGSDGFDRLLSGIDTVGDGNGAQDFDGHGTHVAGTIAQSTRNGFGTAGVAPGVRLLPVQVLGANGAGSAVTVARGIVEAVDAGADVLNLSLGTGAPSRIIEQAVDYATDRGVVLVAASGNAGWNRVDWPAADPDVIAVGAVDGSLRTAVYSNGGSALDLVAPGGDLSRDDDGDGYADGVLQETLAGRGFTFTFFEGTSMAAPHVAGVAALLVAQVGRDPDRVRALLTGTARDLGTPGWDRDTGAGLLDAAAALAAATGARPDEDRSEDPGTEDAGTLEVVLSEVMPDPTAYDDGAAEYIEVWNTGTVPVALGRLGLNDEGGRGGAVSGDGVLEPGQVAVLARDTTAAWPWEGVPLDGLYPSDLFLNNGREVLSLTLDGRKVDAVSWSRAPRGAAAERQDGGWVISETPLAGTRDFGTPGQAPR